MFIRNSHEDRIAGVLRADFFNSSSAHNGSGPTFIPGFHPGKEVKEISSAEIFIAFDVLGSICNLFKVQKITSNLAN